MRVMMMAGATAWLAGMLIAIAGLAASGMVWRVIDGDSFVTALGEHIRVMEVDTPEIRAQCPEERALAVRARALAEDWLGAGPVTIERSQRADRYQRTLAVVRRGDETLAGVLIGAGLGRVYDGRGARGSWCE